MKRCVSFLVALVFLGIAAGAGYWFGASKPAQAPISKSDRKILYYRNPMGLADTSPVPKKD